MHFLHEAHSPRVIFGLPVTENIETEAKLLGAEKILLISDESSSKVAAEIKISLGKLVISEIPEVVMHVPDTFTAPLISSAKSNKVDLIVSVGGGSATGLGKVIALETGANLLAVPTTYAGSEMTPIWGRTINSEKITGRALSVLPKTVIYDATLTKSLPIAISVNSGMNAIAHAVEAMYSPNVSPLIQSAALEGIRIFSQALRKLKLDSESLQVREELLLGSMLCGYALGNSTMGIHHKICHYLGGAFDLPHAQMHSAVLPFATKYNEGFADLALNQIAGVLGSAQASEGLWDLANEIGAETSLSALSFPENKIEDVAQAISSKTLINPRPLEVQAVIRLLRAAYEGSRPKAEPF